MRWKFRLRPISFKRTSNREGQSITCRLLAAQTCLLPSDAFRKLPSEPAEVSFLFSFNRAFFQFYGRKWATACSTIRVLRFALESRQ